MATFTFYVGVGIVGLVGLQLMATTYGSILSLMRERRQGELSRLLWLERIERANAVRAQQQMSAAAWNGLRKFVVDRKAHEADGICSFYLVPRDGKRLRPFKPGQYLTFQLDVPTGTDESKALVRCYSLSDSPQPDYFRVSIKRVPPPPNSPGVPPGRGSNFFHDHVDVGSILDVRAPSGHFVLDPTDMTPAVLIGGGVGITPMLSMINAVAESGSDRELWLFYGVRCGSEQMMREHLRELDRRHKNLRVIICYSGPADEDTEHRDYDEKGHISADLLRRHLSTNNYQFYVCGPPPMMKSLLPKMEEWGVPKDHIHTEAFGPASVKARKPQKPATTEVELPAETAKAFQVEFSKSGKKLAWDAKFSNLLEFAAENGVDIDSACCAGSCGTCQVAIKAGDVEYDEAPEHEAEDGCCLACVGRPKTDLVLHV